MNPTNLHDEETIELVFYVNEKKQLNYIYDTNHNLLQIKEPFLIIGNSGQVWKFINVDRLKKNLKNYGLHEYCGTNLVPINDYYKVTKFEDIKIIEFKHWYNCNTIDDFKKMKKYILQGE